MCMASAVDPLRAANRVAGERLFDFTVVSVDGGPVVTTSGLAVAVDGVFDPGAVADVFVIIGGFGSRVLTDKARLRRRPRSQPEGARHRRNRGGLVGVGPCRPPGRPGRDDPLGGPGGLRLGLSPGRRAPGPLRRRRVLLHRGRRRADLRPDAASGASRDWASRSRSTWPRCSSTTRPAPRPTRSPSCRSVSSTATILALPRPSGSWSGTSRTRCRSPPSRVGSGRAPAPSRPSSHEAIGETPGAYALRLRLGAARRLVLDTAEPMAVIAARSGFSSAAAFSRAFVRAFGHSPTRLRRDLAARLST